MQALAFFHSNFSMFEITYINTFFLKNIKNERTLMWNIIFCMPLLNYYYKKAVFCDNPMQGINHSQTCMRKKLRKRVVELREKVAAKICKIVAR